MVGMVPPRVPTHLAELRETVREWAREGAPLEVLESELVDTAVLDEDARAALWLAAAHSAADGPLALRRLPG